MNQWDFYVLSKDKLKEMALLKKCERCDRFLARFYFRETTSTCKACTAKITSKENKYKNNFKITHEITLFETKADYDLFCHKINEWRKSTEQY